MNTFGGDTHDWVGIRETMVTLGRRGGGRVCWRSPASGQRDGRRGQAPQISISLSGLEEVPAVTTTAGGSFRGNLGANALDAELSANGAGLTQAHIHLGAKGANGPVVAFLFGLDAVGVNAIHNAVTITPDKLIGPLAGNWAGFVSALRSGGLYVNVHSSAIRRESSAARSRARPAPRVPAPVWSRPAASRGCSHSGSRSSASPRVARCSQSHAAARRNLPDPDGEE